jgi:hypothetical protein
MGGGAAIADGADDDDLAARFVCLFSLLCACVTSVFLTQ